MESTLKMELDNMERILDRVSPYLPKSVIEQLEGHEISALDSIRLLSLLPADAFENFPDTSTVLWRVSSLAGNVTVPRASRYGNE